MIFLQNFTLDTVLSLALIALNILIFRLIRVILNHSKRPKIAFDTLYKLPSACPLIKRYLFIFIPLFFT